MKDKVRDIGRAIDGEAYLSALALALTLPDICSKVEYGKNEKNGYSKWFDKYVKDTYFNEPTNECDLPQFDGAACWELRCAVLHSGNADLDPSGTKNIDIQTFELCVTKSSLGANAISRELKERVLPSGDFERTKRMRIDISWLCFAIGQAALNFYEAHVGNEVSETYSVRPKTDCSSLSLYDHRL